MTLNSRVSRSCPSHDIPLLCHWSSLRMKHDQSQPPKWPSQWLIPACYRTNPWALSFWRVLLQKTVLCHKNFCRPHARNGNSQKGHECKQIHFVDNCHVLTWASLPFSGYVQGDILLLFSWKASFLNIFFSLLIGPDLSKKRYTTGETQIRTGTLHGKQRLHLALWDPMDHLC